MPDIGLDRPFFFHCPGIIKRPACEIYWPHLNEDCVEGHKTINPRIHFL